MEKDLYPNTFGEGAHNFLNPDNIRNNGRRMTEWHSE